MLPWCMPPVCEVLSTWSGLLGYAVCFTEALSNNAAWLAEGASEHMYSLLQSAVRMRDFWPACATGLVFHDMSMSCYEQCTLEQQSL